MILLFIGGLLAEGDSHIMIMDNHIMIMDRHCADNTPIIMSRSKKFSFLYHKVTMILMA